MTTQELLSEPVNSARIRESCVFKGLTENVSNKIVLFGAGCLGRKTAKALRLNGIEPLAFADNDPRLQGITIDGIPVLSPAVAADKWRDNALFVVTSFLPSGGGVRSRLHELAAFGCIRITNFLPLGWLHRGVLPHFGADLPSRLLGHALELEEVASLWHDDLSRETFRQALIWRLRANFEEIATPVSDQYFPRDILRPIPNEVFVDGGAFDGDTLRAAPWALLRILAIEPDPMNAAILRALNKSARVNEVLLGKEPGSARFDAKGTVASSRSDSGNLEVSVSTLDELTAGENPTYLKLDVEGDELAALQGGVNMLRRTQPVVAVCAYHRPEDIWTIPLFLRDVLPKHRIFLRAHAWDGFELVIYATPAGR